LPRYIDTATRHRPRYDDHATDPPAQIREYLERFLAIDPFVNLPDEQVKALFEFVGGAVKK
jgi:hypothetical protein